MREKKYKDVIEEIETESEEKLSMTRELKFKELQEHIDENDNKKAKKSKKKSQDIEKLLEEFDKEQKEAKKAKKSITNDDDIYLTSSFKPLVKRFRLKKVFKVLFTLVILAGVIGALAYFVALPMYHKYLDSKPKMIFDHSIDYISNTLTKGIDAIYESDDLFYVDFNFKLESNIEELDSLNNYSYGYSTGIDTKKEISEKSIYILDKNKKYGHYSIEKDNKIYERFSTSDTFLTKDYIHNDFSNFKPSDAKYIIEEYANIFKEVLDGDLMTSSKDELEVDGNTLKVTRHSFTINRKDAERLDKKYYDLVTENKKLVRLLAEMKDLTEEEFLEQFEEEAFSEYDNDYKFTINIYTTKGTEFVGFDIEENGFRNLYYYNDSGNFELYANLTEDTDCLEGNDCIASDREVYEITGRVKNDKTKVSIKYNSILYASLEISDFTKEKIASSYKIYIGDTTLKGNILLNMDSDKKEYNLDISLKEDEEYLNLKMFFGYKPSSDFGKVSKDNVIDYTEDEFEKEYELFQEQIEDPDLVEAYDFWFTILYNPEEFLENIFSNSSIIEEAKEVL